MRGPLRFEVDGIPRPGGSKSAFFVASLGRSVIADSGGRRTKEWRKLVRFAAIDALDGAPTFRGPVLLDIEFRMPRPLRHHEGNDRRRPLRHGAPSLHTSAPDATKLVRSTEDALKGVAWVDDAQVAEQRARKRYADPGEAVGASVAVSSLADPRIPGLF